MNAMMEMMV
jgi:hypothetical protein